MRELHERMLVIVAPRDYDQWLDTPEEKADQLQKLVRPFEEEELVISRVNSPAGP